MDALTRAPARAAYSYRTDPGVPSFPDNRPLVVFDGACVLCLRFARFLLKHDRKRVFRFTAAQSALGAALYAHYGKKFGDYQTHLLIESGGAFFKSDAALRMLSHLGLPWSLLATARIVPRAWRDALYDVVARNRIRWFGARETCFAPSPQDADRFLA